MIVLRCHNANEKAWDQYVQGMTGGTFFHLTGWKRVVEKSFGHQAHYLCVEEGGLIKGVLPLFYVKSLLFGRSLVSVPFGVYGGIVADSQEVGGTLLETAKKLVPELQVAYLELRHIEKNGFDLPAKNLYVTFRREIYKDLDQNMAAIPRKQRRMIRQGIKHGLTSTLGGPELLPQFYNVYAHSVRNLGTPVFPYAYFRNLMEEFGEHCRILSVWYRGKMVGAVMTFFYKDQVMPYYGGALRDYFAYAVNDFMYWELMRYGCEQGYRIFDFGRSRQGTGSFDFKRHWGFESKPLFYQCHLNRSCTAPNLSPSNPRFKLWIAAWKRLPLSVTKLIGPMIVRSIP